MKSRSRQRQHESVVQAAAAHDARKLRVGDHPKRDAMRVAAKLARDIDVGQAKAYKSISAMVADPNIHALWLCGPNQARIENVEEIVHAISLIGDGINDALNPRMRRR